jgi:hypothetical protein
MKKPQLATPEPKAGSMWERLEDSVREHVQRFIQALLEEEVTELLERTKSARREAVDASPGYRNRYGKPRRLTLTSGTITVRRPRVRDLNERFVSRVLPCLSGRRGRRTTAPALPARVSAGRLRVSVTWPLGRRCSVISGLAAAVENPVAGRV